MNTQKLVSNTLSTEQTNQVKGGIEPSTVILIGATAYRVGVWGYNNRRQIASVSKSTYNAGKKAVGWVKGWF